MRFPALLAWLALASGAGAQEACPTREGDTIDAVRKQYGLSADPAPLARKTPGGTAYQYSLVERGIFVFFDAGGRVASMRFNRPFAGRIAGVAIGDSKDKVRALRGEPQSTMPQAMPDMYDLEDRRRRKAALIEALPDPAPRAEVRRAFEDMGKIDAQPIRYLTGWVYKAGSPNFARYDFGSPNDTVQIVFARSCAVE
jgi:hypothetical protein